MTISTEERKKDYHAGPHDSFPLGPAGQHLKQAWDLAGHAADPDEVRRNILAFAHEHNLTDHLPEAAKTYSIKKAEQDFIITKAWRDGATLYREGWISTNDRDRQKEVTEPEAFQPVLQSYFNRCAPVSLNHGTTHLPIGHLQKGALLRDGAVFLEASHPTDPAEFVALPETGTGFYGRMAFNDPVAIDQIEKGNVAGCSFIATVKKAEPLPGGGRRFLEFDELIETTIAAYPVNPSAVLTVRKAEEEKDLLTMTPEEIETLVANAIAKALPPQTPVTPEPEPAAPSVPQTVVTPDQIQTMIAASMKEATDELRKAFMTRNGTGRAVSDPQTNPMEDDPAGYIVRKANSGEDLSPQDKELIAELTLTALRAGLAE